MLKISKTLNIYGQSMVNYNGVETQAVYMTSSVSDSSSNITKNITNQEAYDTNKDKVRKDMQDFEDLIFSIQDNTEENA